MGRKEGLWTDEGREGEGRGEPVRSEEAPVEILGRVVLALLALPRDGSRVVRRGRVAVVRVRLGGRVRLLLLLLLTDSRLALGLALGTLTERVLRTLGRVRRLGRVLGGEVPAGEALLDVGSAVWLLLVLGLESLVVGRLGKRKTKQNQLKRARISKSLGSRLEDRLAAGCN